MGRLYGTLAGFIGLTMLAWGALSSGAQESPQGFTYEGRLYNAAGTAPLTDIVDFKFQIYNSAPPADTCLLYEEVQLNVDLTLTAGTFAINVGSPQGAAKRTLGPTGDPNLTLATIFQNLNSVPVPVAICPGGLYTPLLGEARNLKVTVTPHSIGVPQVLAPDYVMSSVPQALVCESLQGIGPAGLIQVTANITQVNLATLTAGVASDASALHNHDTHNDARYARIGGVGNQNLGSGNLNTTGNVGIGIATPPAANLDIEEPAPTLRLGATGATGQSTSLDFYGGAGANYRASIASVDNSSVLNFFTGGNALANLALQLDSAQNATFSKSMTIKGTVGLGQYTTPQEPALIAALTIAGAAATGTEWVNSTTNVLRYWDGAAAQSIASVGSSTLGGDVTGTLAASTVAKIQGRAIAATPPNNNEVLTWVAGSSDWEPKPVVTGVSSVFGRAGAVVAAGNDYTWAQIDKTISSIADLTTKSAADLTSGTLNDLRLSANVPLKNASNVFSTGGQEIDTGAIATKGLIVKGFAGQTANLQEWQKSDSTILYSVENTGTPVAASDIVNKAYITTITGNYLPLSGGTLSGPLINNSNSASAALAVTQSGAGNAATFMGGKVGIGTNSPGMSLEVSGPSNDGVRLKMPAFGPNSISLKFYDANWQAKDLFAIKATMGTGAGEKLSLQYYNGAALTDAMVFDTAGNVGIGTASPTYGLTVAPTAGVTVAKTAFFQDATAVTGKTKVIVKAGAADTWNDTQFVVQSNTGVDVLGVDTANGFTRTNNLATVSGTILSLWSQQYNTAGSGVLIRNSSPAVQTAGAMDAFAISNLFGFAPTSGTGVFNSINVASTINQTGGANGVTRGLYVNPTLTSAADFRAIETVTGNVILGSTSGKVGIGIAIPTAGLHNASAGLASVPAERLDGAWFTGGTATTTKPQFLVEPSGTTTSAWSINGTGVGINAAAGFTGNLIDAQLNGLSKFSVDYTGKITGDGSLLTGVVAADGTKVLKAGDTMIGPLINNSNSASTALAVTQAGTGYAATLMGGNVGIGTTTPNYKVEINGRLNMPAGNGISFGNFGDGYGDRMLLNANGLNLTQNGGSPGVIQMNENIVAMGNAGGYPFYASQAGVNIGSNNPTSLLTINGWPNTSVDLMNVESSGGASYLFVSKLGAVGVGTSSPTQKLTVYNGILNFYTSGAVEALRIDPNDGANHSEGISGTAMYPVGTTNLIIPASTSGSTSTVQMSSYAVSDGIWRSVLEYSNGNHNLILEKSGAGNVGIGTSAPTSTLDALGSVRLGSGPAVNPTLNGATSTVAPATGGVLPISSTAGMASSGTVSFVGTAASGKFFTPELVTYTGISGNTLTGITRGALGSVAVGAASGSTVNIVLTSVSNSNSTTAAPPFVVTNDGQVGVGSGAAYPGQATFLVSNLNPAASANASLKIWANGNFNSFPSLSLQGGGGGYFTWTYMMLGNHNNELVTQINGTTTMNMSGGGCTNFGVNATDSCLNTIGSKGSVGVGTAYYLLAAPANGMIVQGNVGIGTSSPQAGLDVATTGTGASAIIVPRDTTANQPTVLVNGMIRYNTTTALFEFYQNGAWVNYTTVSDARLKTNVEPVTNALGIIDQLKPVYFDWDQKNPRAQSFGTKHQVGFLAQDVEKVLPEVVNQGEDTYRTLEYGKMVSVTIAAIKELYAKVMGHDVEIQNLKATVDQLKNENTQLKSWACSQTPKPSFCN